MALVEREVVNPVHNKSDRGAVALLLYVCFLLAASGCPAGDRPGAASVDVEKIKAADEAYATAWLTNDPARVMATLTEDAVLIPSGIPAIKGAAGIREFWWPADSPPTSVLDFTLVQREVGGEGEFGFVRGAFSLVFEYDGNTFSNSGDYMSLLRRTADASWRISHRLWSDHPPPAD